MALSALTLNCSLKRSSGEASSTDVLLGQVEEKLRGEGASIERLRIADFNILPGVTSDEGEGDDWPMIRKKVLAADILILGTPIWMGQPTSIVKRVLERMDAFLGETDDAGRMVSTGIVAGVAVVGNEDGAHHVCAELFQALNDVGFSLAPNACTYWVGEAMGKVEYKDLDETPETTASATEMMVRYAAHLSRQLKAAPYPGEK
ncbi:NADPH-dependent oxidoreductase [Arsenicitalea aurantiaca]|uniref:NADPH-dependent oxidoreductase n=1 Tax=Arsenicitalea aurantiaca TaxID=1783274 RepID=A0A433X3I0_9HYPH|nr:NAD(P)H-dependent oxidoreductase [Arsenicitalea aurantiaca]RUT28616.1 NADPH-dependent oxidoreductase [Arsenicitalea aurantiaca]